MALTFLVGAVGLSVVPTVAATGVCHQDFLIPDSEPLLARTLPGNDNETGVEDVPGQSTEILRMVLLSNNDKLQFEIREIDGNQCVASSDTDCSVPEELDTTQQGVSEDAIECELDNPDSGSRTFYVYVLNLQGDSLDYKAFIE